MFCVTNGDNGIVNAPFEYENSYASSLTDHIPKVRNKTVSWRKKRAAQKKKEKNILQMENKRKMHKKSQASKEKFKHLYSRPRSSHSSHWQHAARTKHEYFRIWNLK